MGSSYTDKPSGPMTTAPVDASTATRVVAATSTDGSISLPKTTVHAAGAASQITPLAVQTLAAILGLVLFIMT